MQVLKAWVYLVAVMLFSIKSFAGFPFNEQKTNSLHQGKLYQLEINSRVMKFFDENNLRYFTGALLDIHPHFMDLKLRYEYSFSEKHHYFLPYSAAVNFKKSNGQWTIGRKIKDWDWSDHFWNRGLWEPLYQEDALRPQRAGLTGFFRDFNYKGGQTTLFGSFVFIPTQDHPIKIENNLPYSENPWFTPPPEGAVGTVFAYSIQPFKISDLLRLSLGGRISYKGFYLAYFYKPMNKPLFKADFSFQLHEDLIHDKNNKVKLKIPIEYVILKHHLAGLGWTISSGGQTHSDEAYHLKLALTYNHPEKSDSSSKTSKLNYIQPPKELLFSAKAEVSTGGRKEKLDLHLAYTHQFPIDADTPKPENKNINTMYKVLPDIDKTVFFRGSLLQFHQAVSGGLNYFIYFDKASSATAQARLIYELKKKYFLLSFSCSLTLAYSLSVFMSGDYFFTRFPFSIEQTQDRIGVYSNKSRLFGGLKYAF